jgi:hypothetical protein
MKYLLGLLIVIVLLAAIPFIGLPILVYCTYKMKLQPQVYAFVPSLNSMLKRTFDHFAGSYVALQGIGFELLVCLKMPGAMENVSVAMALLVNRQTRDMAMITAIDADGQEHATHYVEFVRRYRNGDVIQTNNCQALSGLADPPQTTTFRLPSMQDPRQLFQAHQALIARQSPASEPVLRMDEEFSGDAVRYFLEAYPEAFHHAIQQGIFYQPTGGDHVRCTLPGAFRLAWQELWPISAIRRAARDRREQELLAEIGNPALMPAAKSFG